MAVAKFLKSETGLGCAIFAACFLLSWLPLVLGAPTLPVVDEQFQFLEAGHRMAFGYGAVPWEFDYNARSWLLGAAAALPMGLARLTGAGPGFYLPLTWALFALPAAGAALCAGLWGARAFGRWGGLAVALIAASWVDNLYFGARVISESVGAHLLIIAVFLAEPGRREDNPRRLVLAGFLAALAVLLRLQLGPAALLLWLWRWRERRRLLLLGAGAALALLLNGVFDAVTAGWPFQPLWQNVRFNLLLGGAESFGVPPWSYYLDEIRARWGFTALPFLALALIGARRLPLLAAMAAVLLLVHQFIPHKEYRFILPAVMMGAILCGMGAVEMAHRLRGILERQGHRAIATAAIVAAAIGWAGLTLANAAAMTASDAWRSPSALLEMAMQMSGRDDICGIGFGNLTPYQTGSYTFLHRPVPVFHSPGADQRGFIAARPGFNALVIRKSDMPFFESFGAFAEYRLDRCNDEICLFVRPGACARLPRPRPAIGPLGPKASHDPLYPYAAGIAG